MSMFKKIFGVLIVASLMTGMASAGINITQITDALNVIWALVDNIGDNFDSILTLIMFGIVITLIYIFRDFLKGMFEGILNGMNGKGKK